ncbi:DUF4291 domain-containing protein [Glycomyces buryatensis]|uniref:DUF4291 domain-containing protein n=1 Tax=Glycomyces buryatensis TaxID=2570927 RepID=A0A4S8Q3S5_9ACTN|nr:DUF4291 domain-containing protein [Glycomyces buryatensis]THV38680.1 DUF4291 domain-containing protein [Glycomyces buryatensis]
MTTPYRQIRARFDADTITVYQAYDPAIAEPALAAQAFVGPFKRERMTWIKPSFLWMMYRCGWATKPGQTRVLAIELTRTGFEWALAHSSLSHPADDQNPEDRRAGLAAAPVRIQWDPERSLRLARMEHRSIQIGLSGEAVDRYVEEWIASISDVTDLARETAADVEAGRIEDAERRLPVEHPYPLSPDLATTVQTSTQP